MQLINHKRGLKENIIIAAACGVVFLIATLPFRSLFSVFTATEVRPSAVLNPFLGVCFGLPAAIGIAIGNAVADIISGYSAAVVIEGIIASFIYSCSSHILWRLLVRGESHVHRLDCTEKILKFTIVAIWYAVISAIIVGLIIKTNYGGDMFEIGKFVFLNNFTMTMIFGWPLMIISNTMLSKERRTEKKLSFNEKLIVFASVFNFIIIGIVIKTVYSEMQGAELSDIWNAIFVRACISLYIFMALIVFLMLVAESRNKSKQKTQ